MYESAVCTRRAAHLERRLPRAVDVHHDARPKHGEVPAAAKHGRFPAAARAEEHVRRPWRGIAALLHAFKKDHAAGRRAAEEEDVVGVTAVHVDVGSVGVCGHDPVAACAGEVGSDERIVPQRPSVAVHVVLRCDVNGHCVHALWPHAQLKPRREVQHGLRVVV